MYAQFREKCEKDGKTPPHYENKFCKILNEEMKTQCQANGVEFKKADRKSDDSAFGHPAYLGFKLKVPYVHKK